MSPKKIDVSISSMIRRRYLQAVALVGFMSYFFIGKAEVFSLLTILLLVEIGICLSSSKRREVFLKDRRDSLNRGIFFLGGAIIALLLFNKEIAIAAVLMSFFGDLTAAMFGREVGVSVIPHIQGKKREGAIAEFVVNLLIGTLFFKSMPLIVAMAGIATLTETFVTKIDDNAVIPLFAGVGGYLVILLI